MGQLTWGVGSPKPWLGSAHAWGVGSCKSWPALVLAVSLALVGAACSNTERAATAISDPERAATATPDEGKVGSTWCDQREDPLSCVVVEGEFLGVVYPGAPDSDQLVLWDPGGPGLGLPDGDMPFDQILPAGIRDKNVLLVVEPWVRKPPSEECLSSSQFRKPSASADCRLAPLMTSTQSLVRASKAAESQEGMHVTGAYLQSFGATRTLPALLDGEVGTPDWIVLESPGPPVATPALELMAARQVEMLRILTAACDSSCAPAVRTGVDRLARDAHDGRDMALGLIALVALPTDNEAAIKGLAEQLAHGQVDSSTRRELVRLGRAYSGQLQRDRIRPSMVALWADTCPRLTGWEKLKNARDPFLRAYASLFRGCYGSEPVQQIDAVRIGGDLPPVLMLTGRNDAVVPPHIQDLWAGAGLKFDRLNGDAHQWESTRITQRVGSWIEHASEQASAESRPPRGERVSRVH